MPTPVLDSQPVLGLRVKASCYGTGLAVACPLTGSILAIAVGDRVDAGATRRTDPADPAPVEIERTIEESWLMVGYDADELYTMVRDRLLRTARLAGLALLTRDEADAAGTGGVGLGAGGATPAIRAAGAVLPRLRVYTDYPAQWTITMATPTAELIVTGPAVRRVRQAG